MKSAVRFVASIAVLGALSLYSVDGWSQDATSIQPGSPSVAPAPPAFTPQLIRKTTVKILGVGGVDLKELENHALPVAIVNFLHGSGLVVSPDGIIVTARHVVRGLMGAPVVLLPMDDRAYIAKVIYESENCDVAIIKIDKSFKQGEYIDIRQRYLSLDALKRLASSVFLHLVAAGFPRSSKMGECALKYGGVSSFRTIQELDRTRQIVQLSMPINHGISGGPVFTETGQFVGIVSAKEGEGMGLAISADSVIASLNSVRQSDLRAADKVLTDEISRKVSEKYFAPLVRFAVEYTRNNNEQLKAALMISDEIEKIIMNFWNNEMPNLNLRIKKGMITQSQIEGSLLAEMIVFLSIPLWNVVALNSDEKLNDERAQILLLAFKLLAMAVEYNPSLRNIKYVDVVLGFYEKLQEHAKEREEKERKEKEQKREERQRTVSSTPPYTPDDEEEDYSDSEFEKEVAPSGSTTAEGMTGADKVDKETHESGLRLSLGGEVTLPPILDGDGEWMLSWSPSLSFGAILWKHFVLALRVGYYYYGSRQDSHFHVEETFYGPVLGVKFNFGKTSQHEMGLNYGIMATNRQLIDSSSDEPAEDKFSWTYYEWNYTYYFTSRIYSFLSLKYVKSYLALPPLHDDGTTVGNEVFFIGGAGAGVAF